MSIFMPKGAPPGGHKAAWALPGFDQEAFDQSEAGRGIAAMQEIYERYPDDEMHPEVVAYWQRQGIKKELFDAASDGKYAVFTPLSMDGSKRYAFIYSSHGGKEVINKAETNGFPAMVGTEQYICVCPWNRGESNDEVESEFGRILETMLKSGYPIDESRIYATGYSAGSDATGVLVSAYPDVLAAASPNPGGNLFAKGRWYMEPNYYKKNLPYRMPLLCMGGTLDGGDKYPFDNEHAYENFNIWMEHIVKVPGYRPITLEASHKLVAEAPEKAKHFFGFDFDKTYTIRMEGIDYHVGEFLDESGICIARFLTGEGLPHAQTRVHAPTIWDFLKHFSRNRATGASVYTPIAIGGTR